MARNKCTECYELYPKYMIMGSENNKVCKICVVLNEVRSNSTKIEKIRMDVDLIVGKINESNISSQDESKMTRELERTNQRLNEITSEERNFSGFITEEDLKLNTGKKEEIGRDSDVDSDNTAEKEEIEAFRKDVEDVVSEGLREIRGNTKIIEDKKVEHSKNELPENNIYRKGPEISLKNRFTVLEEENGEKEENEYCILGDSIVKHFKKTTKRRKQRNIYSSPGAGMKRITEHIEKGQLDGRMVVLQGGGNDIEKTNTETLMKLFEDAIKKVRERGKMCVVSGILPRHNESHYWSSKAIGINDRVQKYCSKMDGVMFIDNWDRFYHNQKFYTRDGVHLNYLGTDMLSSIIDREVELYSNFLKNQCRTITT